MVSNLVDTLSMQVTLYVSGRNLKNLDVFTKSDPKCEIYEFTNDKWTLVGKTETKQNNLNPDFSTAISMSYFFEKMQKLKFVMMDSDDSTADDLIGEVETNVGAIMGAKAQCLEKELQVKGSSASRGRLVVRAEAVQQSNECYHMQFKWDNAGNVTSGCCGATINPVKFQFYRKVGAQWMPTYATPNAANSQSP